MNDGGSKFAANARGGCTTNGTVHIDVAIADDGSLQLTLLLLQLQCVVG